MATHRLGNVLWGDPVKLVDRNEVDVLVRGFEL
jgi:hypothetical protein